MKAAITGLAAAVLPAIAAAEGFTTLDLGRISTDPACIARAQTTFDEFGRQVNMGEVVQGTWSISGFDLGTANYDAHFICAYGPDNQTQVTLVVYYSDNSNEDTSSDYGERLKRIWKSQN